MCLSCGRSFIWKKASQSLQFSDFLDFHDLVLGRQNRAQLVLTRSQSRKTVSLKFKPFFSRPLSPTQVLEVLPPSFSPNWVYCVDGKWLRRKGVVLIHRSVTDREILWWSLAKSESYAAMYADLVVLARFLPCRPVGIVSDWKGSIRSSAALVFSSPPHQRCLAHVTRDVKKALAKHSPLQATRELRRIGLVITSISSVKQKQDWQLWLRVWEMIYVDLLQEKSYMTNGSGKRRWWYTHKQLRAGYRILTHDQEALFTHLAHPLIPSTNNGLEAINGNIKGKLAAHRGMQHLQQYAFISWLLTFSRVKQNGDLRKLWDCWRTAE